MFFLQPLFVETPGLQVECTVSEASFEVRSGDVGLDGALTDTAVHSSGLSPVMAHNHWQVVDHAVVLIGYGKSGATKYWTIKNSWGPSVHATRALYRAI